MPTTMKKTDRFTGVKTMNKKVETILDQVKKELRELQAIGVHVPARAFSVMTEPEAEEYENNGMSITEIADLACQLATIK